MPFPDLPNREARLTAAKLHGRVGLLIVGADKRAEQNWAIAEVHDITTDPRILGYVLGIYLHKLEDESRGYGAACKLLRLAGADETVAQQMLEWQRERRERERRGRTSVDVPGQQP